MKSLKKVIMTLAVVSVLVFGLASCGSSDPVSGKKYKLTSVELAGTVYSLQDYAELGGLDIAELDNAIEFKGGKAISQGESSPYTFKDNTVTITDSGSGVSIDLQLKDGKLIMDMQICKMIYTQQ